MENHQKKNQRPSFKKILLVTVLVVILLIAALLTALYFYMKTQYLGRSNYVKNQGYTINRDFTPETFVDEEGKVQTESEALLSSQQEAAFREEQGLVLEGLQKEESIDSDISGFLLIGVNSGDKTRYPSANLFLLVTVNPKKETVFLTNFDPDLCADIPEVGMRKLSASCSYGGAPLCVETIRSNYGVKIDHYAMIDVEAILSVLDTLAGDEADTSSQEKTDEEENLLETALRKLRACDVTSLDTVMLLVQNVLPYVTHDIDDGTLFKLMRKLPDWLNYFSEELQIPYDTYFTEEHGILIPNMKETIPSLRKTLYF